MFFEKYGTPLALFVGLIVIAGAIMFGREGVAPTPTPVTAQQVDIANVKSDNSPYVGEKNAPVTLAVWFDFQCRFCKQYEVTTLKEVYEKYVTKGDVRIVYKDFQFLGEASTETALYSRAVWDLYPSKWYEWFTRVASGSSGEVTLDAAGLATLNSALSIDNERIVKRIEEKRTEYEAAIAADLAEGQSFGINATPGSILGKTFIKGAQTFVALDPLIAAELQK